MQAPVTQVTQVTQVDAGDAGDAENGDAPVARRNRHTKRKGRRTYKRANDAKARVTD